MLLKSYLLALWWQMWSRSTAEKKEEESTAGPRLTAPQQESLYSVGGSFNLSDISSSQYNQAFTERRRMTSQCSYIP